MLVPLIEKLMRLLNRERRDIRGCEYDGTADDVLLTRFTFKGEVNKPSRYLHIFRRSDHDRELHDHPWDFTTRIIWPGYIEETERGKFRRWPLQKLYRPAEFRHRVELLPGAKYCVSIVTVGARRRVWGFWNGKNFKVFTDYFREKGC